jgi:WD40 repeat protein
MSAASGFEQRPGDFALSPDGRFLVVAASGDDNSNDSISRLWLWHLDSREARLLPGADRAYRPFWSDDSRFVLFSTADGALKKIDIVGGPAQTLVGTGVAGLGRGGGSSRGDVVLFGNADLGFSVRSGSGGPRVVTEVSSNNVSEHQELPVLLPDGKHFLYFQHTFSPETQGIYLGSIDAEPAEQPSTALILADDGPVFIEDAETGSGYVLFMRERTLLAQRFDAEERGLRGEPVPVATGRIEGGAGNGWISASADGRLLVFREGLYTDFRSDPKTLVWVDRSGTETAIPVPPRNYALAVLSPDGRRIALRADDEIWIWDVERETMARLPNDRPVRGVVWTPDSQRVAFVATDNGEALWQSADGASAAEPLGFSGRPIDITTDGRLLYRPLDASDVLMRSIADSNEAPTPLLATAAEERAASVSPNGRFIVYQSDESGRDEVYVRPFPNVSAARWQISTNGGTRPLWSADGREIYYYVGAARDRIDERFGSGALMVVSIETEPGFRAGVPQQLFAGDYVANSGDGNTYDVAPDGQRFLMVKLVGEVERSQPQFVFAQNWLAAVKRRLAGVEGTD